MEISWINFGQDLDWTWIGFGLSSISPTNSRTPGPIFILPMTFVTCGFSVEENEIVTLSLKLVLVQRVFGLGNDEVWTLEGRVLKVRRILTYLTITMV